MNKEAVQIILLYFICCGFINIILNNRLHLYDKHTHKKLKPNGRLKILFELTKLYFSLCWVISIPILLVKTNKQV